MGSSRQPQYLRHMQDLWPTLEAIFDVGERVEQLVAVPGWTDVLAVLDAEVATIDRQLDGMHEPLPHAQMCLMHGRRGGLQAARDAAGTILAEAEHRHAQQRAKHERGAEPSQRG